MNRSIHNHVGLVGGATGAVGASLARELASKKEWKVYGLSRRLPAKLLERVEYSQIDLNDRNKSVEGLRKFADVTHVFYCGRATHGEKVLESAEDNLRLLDNLLNGIVPAAKNLEHVHLVQGGKYYGVHVGPFATPARENDSRAAIPNFNYEQQDYLAERARREKWSWSASRPNTLLHFSPQIARNIVGTLGAYAAICRELGTALDFPGHSGAFVSVTQMTSIELLARGIAWMATEPSCQNQAFNLTNTDVFRWKHLWPEIAGAFKMACGSIRTLKLEEVMSGRNTVWQAICKKYHLEKTNLDQVANWGFADATLERSWDEIFSHNKCRRLGFDDWDESETRFLKLIKQYQDAKLLPV